MTLYKRVMSTTYYENPLYFFTYTMWCKDVRRCKDFVRSEITINMRKNKNSLHSYTLNSKIDFSSLPHLGVFSPVTKCKDVRKYFLFHF